MGSTFSAVGLPPACKTGKATASGKSSNIVEGEIDELFFCSSTILKFCMQKEGLEGCGGVISRPDISCY